MPKISKHINSNYDTITLQYYNVENCYDIQGNSAIITQPYLIVSSVWHAQL